MAKLTDINKLARLYDVATGGRSKSARTRAERQLTEILIRESQRANARMRVLERSGYDYGTAYDSAVVYLEARGRKRFTVSKRDLRSLYEETLRARAFLKSPESTITGQKAIESKRLETFRKNAGWEFTSGMTDHDLRDFQRFLGNQSVSDYLSFYADSGEAVEILGELFDESNKADKLRDIFEDYQKYLDWRRDNPTASIKDADGITFSEVRSRIESLYESISKRRR